MSEDNNDDKTLRVRPKLGLRPSGNQAGTVRQNFSHGRSKAVVVETKKRKFTRPDERGNPAATPEPAAEQEARPKPQRVPTPQPKPSASPPRSDRKLSSAELDARARALKEAKSREAEEQQLAEAEAQRLAEEDARRAAERAEEERKAAEEANRLRAEAEAKAVVEEKRGGKRVEEPVRKDAKEAFEAEPDTRGRQAATPRKEPKARDADLLRTPAKPRADDNRRRSGKLTLNRALNDEEGRSRSLSAMRRRQEKARRGGQSSGPREKISREVTVPETISVQDLAQRMAERAVDVVKMMMMQGQMLKPGDIIDADTAELIASEMGHTVKRVSESDIELGLHDVEDREEDLQSRPPVVTIMGHVDHGKTSLLDAIREANVVSGEAGGITQHIGAYQVEKNGQKISFIDTPGHAAFTAMRARGAQVTDIAILVVAADDSVMPQTIESINHAKAAGVPIIVAINKIDKPAADASKVRTELLQHEVFVESMGGEVLDVEVSATKKTNLDGLLEAVLLQSELLDLKANPNRPAEGSVVEAQLDKGRGSVATVLIQAGTLRIGDIVVVGNEWGKVRALVDDQGNQIKEAGPSTPVELLGLSGTPQAGDRLAVVENEARAREISDYRQRLAREKQVARQAGSRGSLEQMMAQAQANQITEFPLLIKADVQGSAEAIIGALEKVGNDEVQVRVVHAGAGAITESDISLAEASDAAIIAFNVRANKQARDLSSQNGIEIRYYDIIYNLVDDVKAAMSGLLSPEMRETFIGYAEVLEVFNITKVGKVAGCRVTEGRVARGSGVRLLRDNVVIHTGKLKTLKRFKDEVSEVQSGQECGMAFENYEDIREKDVIECFTVEEIARSL